MELTGLIYFILTLPVIFSVIAIANVIGNQVLHWLNRLTATLVGGAVVAMAMQFDGTTPYMSTYLYVDALSFWVLLIITILYVAMAWVGKSYLEREDGRYGYLSRFSSLEGRYYALSHIFVWTMFLVLLVNNLGLMWVAIEATTLVSALLVSFKFTRSALEATWKYVMVCTVGICLALLGTLILYYGQINALGAQNALNWLYLVEHAKQLDPALTKLAFCFLFVGYGTKIGMAPMHAWLPDAYSEAPSLTSGLLSGSLCTCAIYVLIRNIVIIMPTVGLGFIGSLCLTFAVLTVAVAVPFVVVQRDVKRILAYSSMENIGLMIAGVGLFIPMTLQATLLHMFNHAMVKFVLFYIAGTIIQEYRTKNLMRIHGMIGQVPHTATFWLLGIVGILGMPPLGLFFSKFYIIFGFFKTEHAWVGALVLVLLAGVLIGILYHAMRMLCGKPRRKANGDLLDKVDTTVLAVLLILTCLVSGGISQMPYLNNLLAQAVKVITGGGLV